MAIPVKKKAKVLEAEYVKEPDAILMVVECDQGRFRNQIQSSCFDFGGRDKDTEMKKTAELMIGKWLFVAFDTELDGKIKDHYKLKY